MATFKKLLAFLAALVLTCAGTYFWVARQCKVEATRLESLVEAAATRSRALSVELEDAHRELEELKVWRHLGELQQRLTRIHQQVDSLNYGIAMDEVAAVAAGLEKGDFGERFRQSREELLPFLDRSAEALRRKGEGAHEELSRLERRAFELLSGLEPGAQPTEQGDAGDEPIGQPTPEITPQPTPESTAPP